MLTALISQLVPLGYMPIYQRMERTNALVQAEYVSHTPRKLLILEHNQITKAHHPQRSAIIADTVRDGYKQMTSFCRYVIGVRKCTGDEMLQCLNSSEALRQNSYRWTYREKEDGDTYIDLPLSSEHPSLSTTIFRRVFPNATLDLKMFNAKGSACAENEEIRQMYRNKYQKLEKQITVLRKRMLILAGYPEVADESNGKITIVDMLDEADKREQQKYDIGSENAKADGTYSMGHRELINTIYKWNRRGNGVLWLQRSRPQQVKKE